MNSLIWSFSKPAPQSTVVSNRIAMFLAKTLKLPIVYDGSIASHTKLDTLIMVNGAFAFCGFLEPLAKAIVGARRIIWVQNDYTITPPKAVSDAMSPFRRAFVLRQQKKKPHVDFWTTVEANENATERSRYVNWNVLSMTEDPLRPTRKVDPRLFYYGAFRQKRARYFAQYFTRKFPFTISSTSRKFADEFHLKTAYHVGGLLPENFSKTLNHQGLGLYIEDPASHAAFHSPANRFYEMLSAGLPMVFQPEACAMLAQAGYKTRPYRIKHITDLPDFMRDRMDIAREQRDAWWERAYEHRAALEGRVRLLYRTYAKTL